MRAKMFSVSVSGLRSTIEVPKIPCAQLRDGSYKGCAMERFDTRGHAMCPPFRSTGNGDYETVVSRAMRVCSTQNLVVSSLRVGSRLSRLNVEARGPRFGL